MALPTFVIKAKNAVSKGKDALKKRQVEKSAGEEVTGTITGFIKGAAISILSTLALPIIIIAAVIIFVIVVFAMVTAIPFVVFGVDLGGGSGGSSTSYCNEDPTSVEHPFDDPLNFGLAIPHYLQGDSRWADVLTYDHDKGEYFTLRAAGCDVTSFAMVSSYLLDKTIYPPEVNEAYNSIGNIYWDGFGGVSDAFGIERPTYTSNWDDMKAAIKNDQPVIAWYSPESGIFTNSGHFVVVRGITSDDKYIVNDPSDNMSNYKHDYYKRLFTEAEMTKGFGWGVIFKAKVCENTSNIDYIQWAIDIANDDSHGYCQTPRTGPDYDCSSLVYYALLNSGYTAEQLGGTYPFTTYYMEGILTGIGFEMRPYNESELQPGDILWRREHTGMYVGDGQVVQASQSREGNGLCGQTGDQTGTEIWVSENNNNWTHYFRKTS